jgi:acyl-CoA synthetase (AMP-forming)/AMP-acid ligase II
VEGALATVPGIEHAVVYGVQVPNADGRCGMAAISVVGGVFDGAELAKRLRERLPAYAVPLFLRLREEQETTGTFKYRKVELKREGFDPKLISEPLFMLDAGSGSYVPLSVERYEQICSGKLRL